MDQKPNKFPVSAWVGAALFGILSLIFFGLAALAVMFLNQPGLAFEDSDAFGLVILGLIFAIPFGIISLASIQLLRRGANKVSGVVYFITAIILFLVTLFMLYIGVEVISDVDAETSSPVEETAYILVAITPCVTSLVTTLWLVILSVRVLRAISGTAISPETFD